MNIIDKKLSFALVSIFVILSGQYFLLEAFASLGYSSANLIQIISKVLVALVFVLVFPAFLKNNLKKFIIVYIIFSFIFLIHYFLFKNNRPFMIENIFNYFFMIVPIFLYSLSIKDYSILKNKLKTGSYAIFIFGLLSALIIVFNEQITITYSMSLSYYMLLPALFFLEDSIRKFKLISVLLFILSLLIIVSLGARGPLIPIVLFGVIRFIKPQVNWSYKRVVMSLVSFFSIFLLVVYFENILVFMINILDKIGWSSRTLTLLLSDNIQSSGRDYLFTKSWELIKENPIFGYGIFGDRVYLNGFYSHNIFLELSINFGLLIGSAISIILVGFSVYTWVIDRDDVAILLFSVGFIPLLISGSYLTSLTFWLYMGFVFSTILPRKRYNEKKVSI